MKRIFNVLLALLMLSLILLLGSCMGEAETTQPPNDLPSGKDPAQCVHQWKDANCLAPKTCSLCSATEGEISDHTYEYQENVSLSEFTTCEWSFPAERCTACGKCKEFFYESSSFDGKFGCKWEIETTETKNGEDGALHNLTIGRCSECGLKLVGDDYTARESACVTIRGLKMSIYKDDELIAILHTSKLSDQHIYEISERSDGKTCIDCGHVDTGEHSEHHPGHRLQDLSNFQVCEGILHTLGCQMTDREQTHGCWSKWLVLELTCPYTSTKTDYTDDAGVLHTVTTYTCAECGFVYTNDQYVEENIPRRKITVSVGDVCVEEFYWDEQS